MDVEQSTTPRISRMDLTYLVLFAAVIACVVLAQTVLADALFARMANVALFSLLSISFFHRAVRNRTEQSPLTILLLVVGGIVWLVFTVLILLGQASGF